MLEPLTSAIPLPGGTGGAEGGFAFLFGHMFHEKPQALCFGALLRLFPTMAASAFWALDC